MPDPDPAHDTKRSVPDYTPRDRVLELRRIAQKHAEALADGSLANLDLAGFFIREVGRVDRLLARMPKD
jgi:hypothetical protein